MVILVYKKKAFYTSPTVGDLSPSPTLNAADFQPARTFITIFVVLIQDRECKLTKSLCNSSNSSAVNIISSPLVSNKDMRSLIFLTLLGKF